MQIRTLAIAAALALIAGAAGAAEVEWRLGSSVGPQDPATLQLEELAKRVAARSEGRFEIEVIPIETLGFKNVDSLRVIKQGALDAMYIVPYYVTRDEPLMGVFVPHGMLVAAEENLKVVDTQYQIGEEILRDKWDIVPIARAPFAGLRDLIIVSKEPVNTLDGLRELKFRHFTKDGLKAFNELGVSTQVVPSSELYLALKTGVVDAAVYGPTYAKSQSLYEVTCCMAYLSAFSMGYPFVIGTSPEAWAALPDDLKAILAEESQKMWDESLAAWEVGAAEKDAYTWLTDEGGMQMLDPLPVEDRKAIQAELLTIWKAQCEEMGETAVGYCQRIEAALNQ